jgi:hypothetical protein
MAGCACVDLKNLDDLSDNFFNAGVAIAEFPNLAGCGI